MSYKIKLDNFEGPFDLLFHLIEKEEMDIYNIQISEITAQYLDYIKKIDILNLEVASEFILMAAALLEIKSNMLLPKYKEAEQDNSTETEDPRTMLVLRLLEYRKYKELARELKKLENAQADIYYRNNNPQEQNNIDNLPINGLTINEILSAIDNLIDRQKQKNRRYIISKEQFSIKEKIIQIYNKLVEFNKLIFQELFSDNSCRLEIIISFLAVLQLSKAGKISLFQKRPFGDILITKRNNR
ncbi:MAG TPA: segregation/condensation protein A [Thermoanaerobacterales bacterium]|nr:segregation/condensation protein A [Thermoanaerobacterales bacterium]